LRSPGEGARRLSFDFFKRTERKIRWLFEKADVPCLPIIVE
jgi:hypothetical protein